MQSPETVVAKILQLDSWGLSELGRRTFALLGKTLNPSLLFLILNSILSEQGQSENSSLRRLIKHFVLLKTAIF